MTQFLGDIAFLLELFAVSGGLLLLGRANGSSDSAIHTRIAAWLLLLGGGLSALCTGYYYLSYWTQGAFKSALLVTTAAELALV